MLVVKIDSKITVGQWMLVVKIDSKITARNECS